MTCLKCGKDLPDGSLFCCWCGARQEKKTKGVKTRGNGTGTVYKDKRGKWCAQIVVGWKPAADGKRHISIKRTRSGFATKKDALKACAELVAGGAAARPEKAPRLIEYWETYRRGEYKKLSYSKQVAYRIAWDKLGKLQDRRVDSITVADLRSVVSEACPTYYPARDCRSLLTNLFTLAAADRFADRDLPSYIVLPKLRETERKAFTAEEQSALWRLYESGDRRAAIPLLMIYTGMMPGEAQDLKVSHIDMKARQIVGVGMKTEVRRKTPIVLADAILPLIDDLIQHAQPSGYLWKRVEGDWYEAYYAALAAAGCRRLPPYSCRHTTATALAITEGIAPQTVKQVMRWTTTRMLDRYAHPETSDAIEAVNAIGQTKPTPTPLPTNTTKTT